MEKTTKVRVTTKLKGSTTESRFKINDNMKWMQGKVFEVKDSPMEIRNTSRININCPKTSRDYVFATCDITILSEEDIPPLPKPKAFNPKLLDM